MTQKELGELRRRFRPDKNAISRIYGCYVNSNKEVISYLDESLGRLAQEEGEKYLSLLKKGLSGALGRNLIDIVFSTQQVADSDEHRLLRSLRDSHLKDADVRERFYQTVIQSLDMGESNYLILLAHDAYDVPRKGKDDEVQADASDEVFSYIVCCVCPVKDGKLDTIQEALKVQLYPDGHLTDLDTDTDLAPDTVVSMNFWGFMPSIFPALRTYFENFLRGLPDDAVKAECLLPLMVGEEVKAGRMTVSVLHSKDRWFGMTYREDRARVAEDLRQLHESGVYPPSLRD